MALADEPRQRARLFPVTGIGGADEQERRCTSALLSVIEAVQEFGRAFTLRLGAPAGKTVAFIEVPFALDGKKYRPDGLIQITRAHTPWTALVEVKTGHNRLDPAQITAYLDIARQEKYDVVLTISSEIATTPGVHPVSVDKSKLKKVRLEHLSWGQIHTEALLEQVNRSVADRDQAWILSEFIRYLEDPKSGALDFDDMGPSWVTVRDRSSTQTLRAGDQQTLDVVARFDQLVTFAGLALSRRVGVQVKPALSRKELADQPSRLRAQAATLSKTGQLNASLEIPNAIAPLDVCVDLRANRVDCSATVDAPATGRPTTRVKLAGASAPVGAPPAASESEPDAGTRSWRESPARRTYEGSKAAGGRSWRGYPELYRDPQPTTGGYQAWSGSGVICQLCHRPGGYVLRRSGAEPEGLDGLSTKSPDGPTGLHAVDRWATR